MVQMEKKFATSPDDATTYIEQLETDYKRASNDYSTANANANKLLNELGQAEAWEALMRGYWDALVETDRLTKSITAGFDKAKDRAANVCVNAAHAHTAFFWMLDDMIKLACCIEELKKQVDDCVIALANAPQADPLMTGLKALQTGVEEAFACALDALDKWLLVLKKSEILTQKLGDVDEGMDGGDPPVMAPPPPATNEDKKKRPASLPVKYMGLYGAIGKLKEGFAEGSHIDFQRLGPGYPCFKDGKPPTRPNIDFLPGDCNEPKTYPCKIKDALDAIRACLLTFREEYDSAANTKAEMLTCMLSLKAALDVAKETNAC